MEPVKVSVHRPVALRLLFMRLVADHKGQVYGYVFSALTDG